MTRRLALAGLVGPPLFALTVFVLTVVELDFLHELGWTAGPFEAPDAPWPSVVALGDFGVVLVAAFAVLGASTVALAVAVARTTGRRAGPIVLAVAGLAFAGMAFRVDYGSAFGGGPETWNGTLHAAAFTVAILAVLAAMIAIGLQLRELRTPSWAAAAAALVGLVAALAGGGNLFLYVFFAAVLTWLELVAAWAYGRQTGDDALRSSRRSPVPSRFTA